MSRVVIIGASIAGHTVAADLRKYNNNFQITLVTEEAYPLYERRRLADFLAGRAAEEDLFLCREEFYQQQNIIFLKEKEAESLNLDKKKVFFKDSTPLEYDILIICSGKNFVLPQIPGVKKEGVLRLYGLAEFKELIARLIGETVCLEGRDSFALEVARALAAKQKEVKLISAQGASGLNTPGAEDLAANKQVEVIDSRIVEIIGEGGVQAVRLEEGKIIGTSLVAFIGERKANIGFLKNTGIELCADAISVDENMRTSLKDIYACGSVCTQRNSPADSKDWEEIVQEAGRLALNLASGKGE